MSPSELQMRNRIQELLESVRDDPHRSNEFFQYVWSMLCVRNGLMTVVRELQTRDGLQILLEETGTGNRRVVSRPAQLDDEVQGLAIQAFAHLLRSA